MNSALRTFKGRLKNRYWQLRYHLLCWALYIFYELFFTIFLYHLTTPIKDYIFFYTCNISLFYVHYFLLGKYLDRSQPQYLRLGISILLELIVFLAIKEVWEYFAFVSGIFYDKPRDQIKISIGTDLNRNLYYIFISTVIWSIRNYGKFQRRLTDVLLKKALAEKAHTELQYQFSRAQNAFLKQQINPHMLFNSLNAIYNTVCQKSPKESNSVLLLSDIMRYSFEEPGENGRVPLESELMQLRNLIELNSYRFDYPVLIDLSIDGDPKNDTIIPLILMTLTENMFKHGDLRFSPRSVNIEIDSIGRLIFITKNVPKRIKQSNENTHIGLANTRLRLEYAYPGNHILKVIETDELFTLELTINLKS